MLTTPRRLALVLLPVALFLLTAGAILLVSLSYSDSILRWTADAAILTGAAFLAAVVGLPIALYQLFAVERDIARLALVPPIHYEWLRGALQASHQTLYNQAAHGFGDQPGGRQLYREAFFAHFPALTDDFAAWDSAVGRVQSARVSFAEELERVADEVGVDSTTYDRAAILRALNELSRPSLHLALEGWPEGVVPVTGSVDGTVDVAGIRTSVPRPDSRLLDEDELRALAKPVLDLCGKARELPDVENIAHAQDALVGMIEPLADKVKLYAATETIPVATGCPICKLNVGT